ncbi:MAG: cobyrinate a,c-diamide synthase [Rhodobacteraceae bacterium]|nr:cobyrinate a,c-diamide synthase [Paracoccaceae bacterium]
MTEASLRALVLASPTSAAGKTTLTLSLLRALSRQHGGILAGKSGPDYIDSTYHERATGNPSLTFDAWAMSDDHLSDQLRLIKAHNARAFLIEGAMGIFDGGGLAGRGSTAELATRLGLPVILIIDAARLAHTAPLYHLGIRAMNPGLDVAGVIANRVGSARHLEILRKAIEATGMPLLGSMPRMNDATLPSRHLGLVLAGEHTDLDSLLDRLADQAERSLDLERIWDLMKPPALAASEGQAVRITPPGQIIAVARDDAFAFLYRHIIESWRQQGAEIRFFAPLADAAPPADADAVYLPGGYPELHAGHLANAGTFRTGMTAARDRGAMIYGECGGYMALGQGMTTRDGYFPMLGFLPHETDMSEPVLHLGYRLLRARRGPFQGCFAGHEFHYASERVRASASHLFTATDADDGNPRDIGAVTGKVAGSFAHLICLRPE